LGARATTKREAVVKVLEEFNRRRRMAELVKYSGTFSDRFPTNNEIEAIDAKRDRDMNARTRRQHGIAQCLCGGDYALGCNCGETDRSCVR
jgi:hypothetical protein